VSTYRALTGSTFKVICIEADTKADLLTATQLAEELIDALYGVGNVFYHRGAVSATESGYTRILTLEF
jgi:hypothetical protein